MNAVELGFLLGLNQGQLLLCLSLTLQLSRLNFFLKIPVVIFPILLSFWWSLKNLAVVNMASSLLDSGHDSPSTSGADLSAQSTVTLVSSVRPNQATVGTGINLPNEIHAMIAEQMDFQDIFKMSLTSRGMSNIYGDLLVKEAFRRKFLLLKWAINHSTLTYSDLEGTVVKYLNAGGGGTIAGV